MKNFKKERKKNIKRQDHIVDSLISKAKSKNVVNTPDDGDSSFDKISAINSRSTINGINDNRKKKTEKRDRITPRALLCLILVVVIFALFAVRLFDWQIVHGEEYKKLSVASTSYTVTSQATRGEIYDVNGKPLAVNETSYQIVINRIYLSDNRINDVIVSLIAIMRECGAEYIDELPISVSGEQYVLDEGSAGDVEYIESEAMLNREGLSAQEIIDGLAERYDINNINDPFLRRSVVSVRYNMEKRGFSYQQVYVFANEVDSDVVAVVSERTQTEPAVEIRTTNERVIKNGTIIPHILGVVGALSEEEYEELKDDGYELNDTVGKFGIEAGLEDYLRGEAGEKTITKDADGNIVSEKETVKAKPGDTVYLTIDSNIQAVTNYSLAANVKGARLAGEQAVREAKATNAKQQSLLGEDCIAGAAVMLDLRDFSVIAAASAPNYDLSKYYDPDYSEYLFTDDTVPMFNRAFNGAFAPGSSFKPCTALAALQEGIITEDTIINCTGTYDYYKDGIVNCLHKHGEIDMTDAMAHSCNYYFAEVGRRIGITTMYLYAEKLGLGVKTGLEVNEDAGFLAGRDSTTWYEGNTVQAAIGQSDNTFTPVQLATYVATIANNGVRYKTHLVRKIVNYEQDETVLYNDPEKPEVVADAGASKSNINKVKRSMREVLISGTAMDTAGKYPMEYAGKTGTAENAGSDHVTFVCFAPYEKPEIAIAVVLEHGAKSRYAQYVAMDMMDAYFNGKTLDQLRQKRWS
ncbi:MAG: penicillin-binding protein [Ruminococcus sp.]|nr:penicillin-binding protein [Ruminococcus sp.]